MSKISDVVSGYAADRFLHSVDENFFCTICQAVLRSPVYLPCEHMFCKSCINERMDCAAECPQCQTLISREDFRQIPLVLGKLMANLEIKCSYNCGVILKLDSIDEHEQKCGMEISCPVEQCTNNEQRISHLAKHLHEHSKVELVESVQMLLKQNENLKTIISDQTEKIAKITSDYEKAKFKNDEYAVSSAAIDQKLAEQTKSQSAMKHEVAFLKVQVANGRVLPDSAVLWHRWSYVKPATPDEDMQQRFFEYVQRGYMEGVNDLAFTNQVDLDGEIPYFSKRRLERDLECKQNLVMWDSQDWYMANAHTAFKYACKQGNEGMANLLLQCGANADSENVEYGESPLEVACRSGMTNVVRNMLGIYGSKSVNITGFGGNTPLHWAAQNENYELVNILLRHGADPSIRNDDNLLPVHIAKKKKKECCRLLEDATPYKSGFKLTFREKEFS